MIATILEITISILTIIYFAVWLLIKYGINKRIINKDERKRYTSLLYSQYNQAFAPFLGAVGFLLWLLHDIQEFEGFTAMAIAKLILSAVKAIAIIFLILNSFKHIRELKEEYNKMKRY